MAISLKTEGTWAQLTADGTVTIPGTPAAGDRMFLFASWKTYTITVVNPTGWTPIGSEFADGTVAAGISVGSMKVMAWFRNWQTGDAAPNLDFSVSPTIAGAVINLWQKAAGEVWTTPLTVTAAMTNWTTTSQIVSASAAVAVPSSGVVMGLIGIRNDSATMTRPTTGIDDSTAAITWAANYAEAPATHLSTTTGQDMSADLGHRLVTTGATVTLRMTGTISAAETGAAKWVVEGVNTSSPQTATPTTVALTLTAYTPTVSAPRLATPTTAALTLTAYAPTVSAPRLVTPTTASLTLTAYAPTVLAPRLVTPTTAALTLTAYIPSVVADTMVTPTTASLTLTTYIPTVTVAGGGITVIPITASLVLTGYAPTVTATANVSITPTTASLVLMGYAPTITINVLVTPTTASLVLTGYAPLALTTRDLLIFSATPRLTLRKDFVSTIFLAKQFAKVISLSKHREGTGRLGGGQLNG